MASSLASGTTAIFQDVSSGDSLRTLNLQQIANSSGVRRACAIEIRNHHARLQFAAPEYYLYSGINQLPPAPFIGPGCAEACLFRKKFSSPFGCSGVLVYDIQFLVVDDTVDENDQKTAVTAFSSDGTKLLFTWSVGSGPSTIRHAIGIARNMHANREIYDKMADQYEDWFQRKDVSRAIDFQDNVYGIPIKIYATISNTGRAMWTIDIR